MGEITILLFKITILLWEFTFLHGKNHIFTMENHIFTMENHNFSWEKWWVSTPQIEPLGPWEVPAAHSEFHQIAHVFSEEFEAFHLRM